MSGGWFRFRPVSYTHGRAHETRHDLVCRLLLEKKKTPCPVERRHGDGRIDGAGHTAARSALVVFRTMGLRGYVGTALGERLVPTARRFGYGPSPRHRFPSD